MRKHWTKDEVLTAISLESLRFFNWQQELLLRDNILLAFPMLQLLKIVFTFGKELLIALCQSGSFKLTKRSRGYKPLALRLAFLQTNSLPKKWATEGKTKNFRMQNEILDGKHLEKTPAFFSPNSRAWKQQKVPANISSDFLVEIGKLIQVTKITRSNRDKSPYKS